MKTASRALPLFALGLALTGCVRQARVSEGSMEPVTGRASAVMGSSAPRTGSAEDDCEEPCRAAKRRCLNEGTDAQTCAHRYLCCTARNCGGYIPEGCR